MPWTDTSRRAGARRRPFTYDSPVTGAKSTITFAELQDQVARFAGVLQERAGVGKGDRVIIYMPMIPEAIVAMLACARLGAVHSVVFGGFAPKELAVRIDDAKPRAIVSATCGIEPSRIVEYKPLVDDALELCQHLPATSIVVRREGTTARGEKLPEMPLKAERGEVDYREAMASAHPVPCAAGIQANDPLYVLYTSGTTGTPKGVLRDTGSMVALQWSMSNIMRVQPGDTYWAASDLGWVVGHSYICYGPLVQGCASVLFEGKPVGTPDASTFWRIVEEYKVNSMFTAPTALRAIRKVDPEAEMAQRHDLSSLRALFLAGERGDPATVSFYRSALKLDVVDNFWQTETGWPVLCWQDDKVGCKPGSASMPVPGYDVQVLDPETSEPLPNNELGDIAVRLPLPPGTLLGLYNNDQRYVSTYLSRHEGYYLTGDAGTRDDDGYVSIMSRTDDLIKVAGHLLSTGGMEAVLASHPAVAECAVVGVADKIKGQVPIGLLVLRSDATEAPAEVERQVVAMVRAQVGPVAAFKTAIVVDSLPKTRSGKVLRVVVQRIADEEADLKVPGTVEDMGVVDNVKKVVEERWVHGAKQVTL